MLERVKCGITWIGRGRGFEVTGFEADRGEAAASKVYREGVYPRARWA